MYGRKIRFNLFQAIFAVAIGIPQGLAATSSRLSHKTYVLTFGQVNGVFRFYIDSEGRVFQYANDVGGCGAVGSFTKLNASNRGQVSCSPRPDLGTAIVSFAAKSGLSGSAITYDLGMNVRSTRGVLPPHATYRWVFSTDGARCDAISYLVNNKSFPAISCEVSAGHP
jgi:hypothetical protein